MERGLFRWKYWNHDLLYIFGCMVLMAGLPWSNFLMSLGQFILLGNWILEFDLIEKSKKYLNNKVALLVTTLFLIHVFGLLWTSDFEYALKDLRIKLPLLFLPIVFASAIQFSKKTFHFLIDFFIVSISISTFVSFYKYLTIEDIAFFDKRNLAINISHIRFSLLICLAAFFSLYRFYKNKGFIKIPYLMIALWLISFLFILESYSGIVIISILLPTITVLYALRINNKVRRIISSTFVIAFTAVVVTTLIWRIKEYQFSPIANQKMLDVTEIGSPYFHDTTAWSFKQLENGHYIYQNVAYWELEDAWNEVSTIPYSGKDANGDKLYITLIRFITSKGEPKNKATILSLNQKEIKAIEAGVANINYLKNPAVARIDKIIWEFDSYSKGLGTSGHSVASRIVYWKQAWRLIKKNMIIGVGTGDVQIAFEESYKQSNSGLNETFRLRAHNQYLTFGVTFGIIGLAIILIIIIYPIILSTRIKDYYYLIFISIALLSMINEDTLETQAGGTFFAFFNAFLLFSRDYLPKTS